MKRGSPKASNAKTAFGKSKTVGGASYATELVKVMRVAHGDDPFNFIKTNPKNNNLAIEVLGPNPRQDRRQAGAVGDITFDPKTRVL